MSTEQGCIVIIAFGLIILLCMWMCKTWDACVDIRKIAETLEEIKEQINSNKNEEKV